MMTLDSSKFQQNAVQVDTSAGKLWLYPQRAKDLEAFAQIPADIGPHNRLRSFLPYIAFRLAPDDGDGAAPLVDSAWCQQLSDEDLERIANAYLSSAFFHDVADDDSRPSDRGATATETATEHLDRLLAAKGARHREELRQASELFRQEFGSAFATLSADADTPSPPAEALASHSDHDQAIARDMSSPPVDEELRPGIEDETGAEAVAEEQAAPGGAHEFDASRDAEPSFTYVPGEELAAAEATGNSMDAPAELPSDVDETTTHLPKEIAADAARSDASARWSLRIAISALLLSAIVVAVAVFFSVERYDEQKRNNEAMSKWQESVSQMIKDSAAAQERRLQLLDEKLTELSARQNALEASRVATAPEATPPKRTSARAGRSAKGKRSPKPPSSNGATRPLE
jgi:hypothetical protein